MKRVCAALLCLLLAGLLGCGQQEVKAETVPWGVTIERIDLEKPENKHYIDWAKKHKYSYSIRTYREPKYFDIDAYLKQATEEPDLWTYDIETDQLREKHRPWNDTMELMIRSLYEDEYFGYNELLIREKATGETERVAKGAIFEFDAGIISVIKILSNTRFLYQLYYWHYGPNWYFLYDLETRGSICLASNNYDLCDLGDERYIWCDLSKDTEESALYLIDMRALEAGEKDAKRTLYSWDSGDIGEIRYLSSDKRFVHVNLYRRPDNTWHRGIYNIETGEQVAFFELPFLGGVLISDDLEYGYQSSGNVDDSDIIYFHIIRYDRTGGPS